MSNATADSKSPAAVRLESLFVNYYGLTPFQPTLKKMLIDSEAKSKRDYLKSEQVRDSPERHLSPPRMDTLIDDVSKKMNVILNAESIAKYISFYKTLHSEFESRSVYFQEERSVKNPSPFLSNNLHIWVGGKDYPAYKKAIRPIPHIAREVNAVEYSIYLEHAAAIGLMDTCIEVNPSAFLLADLFSETMSEPKNLRIAVRANRAFLYTDLAQIKLRRFSSKDLATFHRGLDKVTLGPNRERLQHRQIRRALILMKAFEPNLFKSRKTLMNARLTAKDFLSIFRSFHVPKMPSADHMNQILNEFIGPSPEQRKYTITLDDLFTKQDSHG